jgi:hypothetical protein
MNIETTVNINIEAKLRLTAASEVCGIPVSRLIMGLMKRTMKKPETLFRCFTRVQYQRRSPKKQWKLLHLSLFPRDYEYLLDMRKFFKCSVSFLVAYSIDTHLDSLINEVMDESFNEDADNYPFQNYIILHEMQGKVSCWKIIWGMPNNPETVMLI